MSENSCKICQEGWGVSLVGMTEQLTDLQKQLDLKDKQIEVLKYALSGLANNYSFGNGSVYEDINKALEQFNKMGEI